MADASNSTNNENENTEIRKSEILTYRVRKGTDNQGYIYEKRNMLGLYALRFSLSEDVKDVLIASNSEGFEALDDMILRVEYHTGKTKLYFMQLKYKEKECYHITASELKGNKPFSLEKYKKSYDVIKTKLDMDILTKNIVLDDIIMCVVTNACFPNTETVSLDSFTCYKRHNSVQNVREDLIDNKLKGYLTFETHTQEELEYLNFFRYFRFYDGQLNCEEAEKEIARLLKISFEEENSNITDKFLQFIETWFKKHKTEESNNEKKKQERYILRKKDVKIKLLELLTGITDENQLNKKYQIFEDVTNVHDYDQRMKILKNIDISLQGKSPITLYDLTKKSFHETVSVSFLLKNIKETVCVGSTVLKKPDNYIKRQFYKILLQKKILWKTTKIIFLFNTSLPANLNNKIKIFTDLETNNFSSYRFTDKNLAIIVPKNEFPETINYIRRHKDLTSFSLCHVKVYNRRYLEWQRSWSHTEDLNKFVVHEELVDELEVLEYFKSKINVVSANPGMGKTTVLNSLASECKPNVLVLRFDLNTHEKDLQDENSDLRQNPLNYIVKKMKSEENNEFEGKLFHHLKKESSLILFIDGFDEISPKHSNAALTLIQELKKNQISIWIFTRPLAKSFLEKRYGLIPINIVPLRNDEIKNYLIRTVGQERNEDMNSFLSSSLLNLCNVPLYLHMLANVIKGKKENLQDLKMTDLYDNFIDMTYQKHMEKRNIDENTNKSMDLLEYYKPKYLKIHKTAALIVIFGENYLLEHKILKEKDINEIKDINIGKKNYELIVSADDGTPIFSHRTYAEYFAALKIYEFLQKEKFCMLYELLFKEKFQVVREMFDRITAKTLPLHLAAVEKDFEKVEELCYDLPRSKILETDEFGRTVLHFAMNSCRSSDFKSEESVVSIKIADLLMGHLKDDEAIFKQRDSILNLNFYEHAKKCENVSLFHLAASLRAINILECMIYTNDAQLDINKKLETGKTPIHCAAENGFLDVIKLLKENGGNINAVGPDEWTALHYASYHEHEECVDFLIKEGANVNQKTKDLCTPLHCAVETGNVKIIKSLIQKGGRMDVVDSEGLTPLHYASECGQEESVCYLIKAGLHVNKKDKAGRTSLHLAAENGHVDIIELLKKKGGRINEIDLKGLSALHYASINGFEDCVDYLINEGANVNQKGQDGKTPMHDAAENGHINIITLLNEKGGGIDYIDSEGLTALHYAALNGSKYVSKCLIEAGADINKKTNDGQTPMHCAAKNGHVDVIILLQEEGGGIDDTDSDELTALHHASDSGHENCVDYLLSQGADVNKKTIEGETPIHCAAENGHVDVIILLQEEGGGIDDTDSDELTALHHASESGHENCVDYLLSQGADVNKKTIEGETPMHCAAENGHVNVIRLLKENGGNIDDVDVDGLTVLHCAALNGHTHCLEYLIELGANVDEKDTNDKTAMHYAAENGHVNVIKLLSQKYGKIDSVDSEGSAPLHYAALKGNIKCLDFLIQMGADVNQRTKDYSTPMHCSAVKGHVKAMEFLKQKGGNIKDFNLMGETLLHYASSKGHSKCVEYLISEGLDVNKSTNSGKTPMFYAAEYDYSNVIKLLKKRGARTNDFNWDGLKVLHYAALNGSKHTVTFLLETGAPVNQKSLDGRTAVHYAAESGHLNIIKLLKERGATIEAIDSKGLTALHYAVFEGNENCINSLIKLGTDVNIKANDGRTPIHFSAKRGDVDILKFLNEKGGNIYETDLSGMSPLHYASQDGHVNCVEYLLKETSKLRKVTVGKAELDELKELHSYVNKKSAGGKTSMHYAALNGNLSIIKLLKEKGGIIDDTDLIGMTPLHCAAFSGKKDCLDFLIKAGADINKETLDGRTPIHFCADRGYTNVIRFLKVNGGNVNVTNSTGETPLHCASFKGHTECVKYLLEEGLDVNEKNYIKTSTVNKLLNTFNGKNAEEIKKLCDEQYLGYIMITCFKERLCAVEQTPMHYAAAGGHMDVMMLLAKKGGRIDNIDSQGFASFHYAVQKGNILNLEYLLNLGADINQKTTDGRTPMHCAAENGHVEIITFLKEKNVNVNEVDLLGRTALHYAAINGHVDCIKCLINAGANVDQKTYDGETPLCYAIKKGHEDAIKLLK